MKWRHDHVNVRCDADAHDERRVCCIPVATEDGVRVKEWEIHAAASRGWRCACTHCARTCCETVTTVGGIGDCAAARVALRSEMLSVLM